MGCSIEVLRGRRREQVVRGRRDSQGGLRGSEGRGMLSNLGVMLDRGCMMDVIIVRMEREFASRYKMKRKMFVRSHLETIEDGFVENIPTHISHLPQFAFHSKKSRLSSSTSYFSVPHSVEHLQNLLFA